MGVVWRRRVWWVKGAGGEGNSGKWVEEWGAEVGMKYLTGSGWGTVSERLPERNSEAGEHPMGQREEERGRSRDLQGDWQVRVE